MLEELMLSLSVSSVVPIIARTLIEWIRARKAHKVTIKVNGDELVIDLEKPEEAELFLREHLARDLDAKEGRSE
ncbi:hypothetical protein ACGFZ9_09370 [Streptomyces mirabilis]|uniref:hypothetical protein n=1 Tax=Streptomyces mirabilis TaxID=68239 RepID=UPI00371FD8FD